MSTYLYNKRRWRPSRFLGKEAIPRLIVATLLLLFGATAWCASLRMSATADEPSHLTGAWTQVHLRDFRFDHENPPLWKYLIAWGTRDDAMTIDQNSPDWISLLSTIHAEGRLGRVSLFESPHSDASTLLQAARGKMLFFGISLGLLISWWAWRLGGAVAGVVASAAFYLDPNFLAHAPLVKNDVPIALALFALAAATWLLGRRATPGRWLTTSLALGAAIMMKFSGLMGIPILGIALLARALLKDPWKIGRWTAVTRQQRIAAAAAMYAGTLLVVWGFIWACYGFRFGPSERDPALRYDLIEEARHCAQVVHKSHPDSSPPSPEDFAKSPADPSNSVLFIRTILFANQHQLFPQSFLDGLLIDYAAAQFRANFFMGKSSGFGHWTYFPVAMLVKTPTATLFGLMLCLVVAPFCQGARWKNWNLWTLFATTIPPVFYLAVAMNSNVNVGIRHIFPIYPFIFLMLGVAAAGAWRAFPRSAGAMIVILIAGLAVETYRAYPNFIPFFNITVGGLRGGSAILGDSNVDWGQDLPALANWQQRHPERQLYLFHFGSSDPSYYGIHYINMAGSGAPNDQTRPSGKRAAFAIDEGALTYASGAQIPAEIIQLLQKREPTEILGGSIYIYDSPWLGSFK